MFLFFEELVTIMKYLLTIILTMLFTATAILVPAAWAVGSFFVDFTLKTSNGAPPTAYKLIMGKPTNPPDKPEMENEEWRITSDDGISLAATHFSPEEESHRWAILVHGYGRTRKDTWNYAADYLAHGYEVLTPDLRAAGKSGGEYITMGAKESDDIVAWARRIRQDDPEAKIVLHGVSMGGATVLLASAKENLPESVTAIIEDCSYASAEQLFTVKLESALHLPPAPILADMDFAAKRKTGIGLDDMEPLAAVPKSKAPTLFIHGDADNLAPLSMMKQLYDASNAPEKEQFVVPGAIHAAARSVDPDAYAKRILAFADRYTESD